MQHRATFTIDPAGPVGKSVLRRFLKRQVFKGRFEIVPSRTEAWDDSVVVRFAEKADAAMAKLFWP